MNDTHAMREGECVQHLAQIAQRLVERPLSRALQEMPQRFPGDVGRHVVKKPVPASRRQHRKDVRVLEPRRDVHLALEALRVELARQLRREQLDDDLAIECSFGGQEEPAHPSRRKLALQGIRVAQNELQPIFEGGGHWCGFRRASDVPQPAEHTAGRYYLDAVLGHVKAMSERPRWGRCSPGPVRATWLLSLDRVLEVVDGVVHRRAGIGRDLKRAQHVRRQRRVGLHRHGDDGRCLAAELLEEGGELGAQVRFGRRVPLGEKLAGVFRQLVHLVHVTPVSRGGEVPLKTGRRPLPQPRIAMSASFRSAASQPRCCPT